MLQIKEQDNNLEYYLKKILANEAKFEIYYNFLIEYNKNVNLTAITQKQEVFTKHFLDSVLAEKFIPQKAKVIDVGAGAGFPSLPLKIVRPDIDLTMLDSLNKRITFLNLLTSKLNIKTNNIHARAEDYAKQGYENFDVAVARAVAKTNTLVEYLLPYVKVGGVVLLYKGGNYLEELTEAKITIEKLGGVVDEVYSFKLPNNMGDRAIIKLKKIKHTPTQFPRLGNLPKLKPIS